VAHYHTERNHQGLGNVIPILDAKTVNHDGKVARRQRLGGGLNYYHREAA
jgi:putative transposase